MQISGIPSRPQSQLYAPRFGASSRAPTISNLPRNFSLKRPSRKKGVPKSESSKGTQIDFGTLIMSYIVSASCLAVSVYGMVTQMHRRDDINTLLKQL